MNTTPEARHLSAMFRDLLDRVKRVQGWPSDSVLVEMVKSAGVHIDHPSMSRWANGDHACTAPIHVILHLDGLADGAGMIAQLSAERNAPSMEDIRHLAARTSHAVTEAGLSVHDSLADNVITGLEERRDVGKLVRAARLIAELTEAVKAKAEQDQRGAA